MERICPQCGYVNRAAGIFCAQCGARITEPPQPSGPRRRFNPLAFLFNLIRWAITLAVIAFLAAILWPPPLPAPVSDAVRARAFEETMERLLAESDEGRPAAAIVTEHDINAYLCQQLAAVDQSETSTGMRAALRQVRVDLQPRHVRVTADTAYGPLRIVLTVVGEPVVTEQGFSLRLQETRVGRVPFPVAYGGWIAERVKGIVEGLQREREVLERLTRLDIQGDKAQLVVGQRKP